MQKTWLPSKTEVEATRKWHHLDASSMPLGRLASKVAVLLTGKHKRIYTPSMDCGDFVVVTNAANIKVTGNKAEDKNYFRHTGYRDGAKITPFKRQLANDPTKIIALAVRRMIDDNKLRAPRMKRLKIYAGKDNPFAVRTEQKAKA